MNATKFNFVPRCLLSARWLCAVVALCVLAGPARAQDFSISSLSSANATVIEVNSLTGDDRGGIAVSGSHVFLSGDAATARFARGTLAGGAGLGVIRDALVSDLRTERAYLLANGTTPITPKDVSGSVLINSLLELDSTTGVPNGTVVTLSSTISVPGNGSSTVGIFAGWGRVLIHNGTRVYQIALPSGTVTDLGALGIPTRTASESWAYWGVAETIGGVNYLAYVRSSTTIARTRVSDGTVSTIATFANLNDMASFTVVPSSGRWYFHHEGTSQFRAGDETLGFADATMVVPPNPPTISSQPASLNVITTEAASFSVAATGAQPITYQWQKNGVDIVGATSSTLTIPSTVAGDAAVYTVVLANTFGTVTSAPAVLTLEAITIDLFKITSLKTNNFLVIDPLNQAGDDRGGLVASATRVFLRGDDGVGAYNITNLTGGYRMGTASNGATNFFQYDSLISDMRSQKVYVLGNGTTPIGVTAGTATTLLQLDGTNGAVVGAPIPLSSSIALGAGGLYTASVGLFSGWGRLVVHNGSNAYSIDPATGTVTDLGAMARPVRVVSESWAYWGVAEFWGGSVRLVYGRDAQSIVRATVPSGATEVVGSFANLNDLANFTAAPVLNRWYFHNETVNQFTNYINFGGEVLGYADATFIYQPVGQILLTSSALTVLEDSGAATLTGFVTEAPVATATFSVSSDNAALFSSPPAIAPDRTLTFTPAANAIGSATVTITARDAASLPIGSTTFTVTVTSVNDAPSFALPGTPVTVLEDSGAATAAAFATSISAGPANESAQVVNFLVANDNNALFSSQPAIAANGTLTFTPALNAFGSATVTVRAQDNGGTANGGVDTSAAQTFTINVTGVNDAPSITFNPGTTANAVTAWGRNAEGQTTVPAGLSTAVSVGGGGFHSGALKLDGTVVVWGSNAEGQLNVPGGLTGVTRLSVGGYHNLALKADGTVAAWGRNVEGQSSVPAGLASVTAVAAGANHSLALKSDGTVVGWGWNDNGQSTVPVGLANVSAIAAGGDTSLALKSDGTVVAWGENGFGQATVPPGLANVVAIAAGSHHSLALKNDGTVVAWGRNSGGEATVPVGLNSVTAIAGGLHFSLALLNNGSVVAWGENTSGKTTVPLGLSGVTQISAGFEHGITLSQSAGSSTVAVSEDSGAYSGALATISTGPANESAQSITSVAVTGNSNPGLFSVAPSVSTSGVLTFTPAANANGSATVTIRAQDNGGTANGGVDLSAPVSFTIVVTGVNDAPSFAIPPGSPAVPAGGTWTARESGRNWNAVASSADGTKLVAVVDGGQIFTSTDSGATWTARENARGWSSVASSADGTKLVAVVWGGQIYTSTDSGVSWTARESTRNWRGVASSADGTKLVAVDFMGSGAGGQIYTSTDSGATWTARESNRNWVAAASSTDGSKLVAVSWGGQIYTSTDSGVSWTARASNQTWHGVASSADGSKLVAGVHGGQLYTSTDSGATWTPRASGLNWTTVASSADGVNLAATAVGDRIYTSTDSGVNWTARENYRNWRAVASSADGSKLVAVVIGGGQIYTSVGSSGAPYTVTVNEDAGAQSVTGFATSVSAGPTDESAQAVDFLVSNDNNALFSSQPAVAANGTLTFTPALNANGTATVTVRAHDDGGTANGGVDTSAAQTFTIIVNAVNDAPIVTFASNPLVVGEDSAAATLAGFATITTGPANESGQLITSLTVNNDNSALFTVAPAIAANGTLTFTPAPGTYGSAVVTVTVQDNGGTANGGVDTTVRTFTLTVASINDPPVITLAGNVTVNEDSGPATRASFAAITPGPVNESSQVITSLTVSSDNPTLFSVAPAIAANGTLTFTPAANRSGVATVTVTAQDDGGTADGGVDTATTTFTITVNSVNDAPTFALRPVNTQNSLLNNGSFETGDFTGWVVADTATATPTLAVRANGANLGFFNASASDGTQSATHGFNGANAGTISIAQDVTLPPGGAGTLTFTYRLAWNTFGSTATSDRTFRVSIQPAGGGAELSGQTLLAAAPNTFGFQTANQSGSLDLSAYAGQSVRIAFVTTIPAGDSGNGSFQLDNVRVSATTPDFTIYENSGSSTTTTFATDISAGPADESAQTVAFQVSNNNNGLFSSQPAIAADGTLTFTPATDINGVATVTVRAQDNGGTANGGVDTSVAHTFTITVLSVNSAPRVTVTTANVVVNEDSAAYSGTVATVTTGPVEEAGQTITGVVTSNDNNALFSVQPSVSASGGLTFTPAANQHGSATVTFTVQDSGGTANGGVNQTTRTLTITVNSVNDAPSFALPAGAVGPAGVVWTPRESNRNWLFMASSADGTKLAAVVQGGQIYTSSDSGVTWTARDTDRNWAEITMSADGTKMAATVTGGQIYTSSDSGVTWTARDSDRNWRDITSSADGTKLAAVDNNNGRIYTSSDSGVTWTAQNSGSRSWTGITMTPDGSILVATHEQGMIYRSDDSGVTWTALSNAGARNWRRVCVSSDGTKIAAGTYGDYIYTSHDSGATWTARTAHGAGVWYDIACSSDGTKLVTGNIGGRIYTSTDSGATWTAQDSNRNWLGMAMSADGSKLAATVQGGQLYTSVGVPGPYVLTVLEDSGAYTGGTAFATSISAGPADESAQVVDFLLVSNDNNALFSAQPAIAPDGTLTFTPALNATGTATVTVRAHDDGGTANGGVDTSAAQTFTIVVTPVNDAPTITLATTTVTVLEESGAYSGALATLSTGPANESSQSITAVTVTANNNTALFSVQPAVSTSGVLTFTPAANANGSATVTIRAQDNGGTANGGVDLSAPVSLTIVVTGVNDAPSFALPGGPPAVAAQGPWTVTTSATGFNRPLGVVQDSSGNLFVVDAFNHAIRKVTPAGVVTTFAGTVGTWGTADGTGASAGFETPGWITIDAADNLYVTDGGNGTVRKITPAAVVTTLAGLARNYGSTDGTGSDARFNYPTGIALDNAGNVYVAEGNNNTIRKITPAGVVTTLAGTAGTSGGTDGTGAAARFNAPMGMGIDSAGNLYVGEQNGHTVRKVTPAGVVTTVAGLAGSPGAVDGTGSVARFYAPQDVKVDAVGNLLVADFVNHAVRQVTPAGVVTTIIGELGSSGLVNGNDATVRLNQPRGLWIDAAGAVYIGEWGNNAVRKAVPAVAAVAGGSPVTLTVAEDSGAYTGGASFATSISAGPADESAQVVDFLVSNDNNALFSSQPTIAADGTLTFTPALNATGTATVTVRAHDDGGTANGGVDTSAAQTFTITVNSVNDAPSIALAAATVTGYEDTAYSGALATFSKGPADESGQNITAVTVTANNNPSLFSVAPAVSTSGVLTFTPVANANGSATVTIRAQDNGGTANGGVDMSASVSFTIVVTGVNDAPSFALPAGPRGPAGATWTAQENNRSWRGVASSADGSKLVAAVAGGQLYTSTDSGVTWTARESSRNWYSVASSADGSKLVAVEYNGRIYTSTDSGETWTARESNQGWVTVASSADGSKLVAAVAGGQLYTSTDSGVTWTARESSRNWNGVTSSSDGSKLVAVVYNGQIHTSADSGETWTARENSRIWISVASSSDGSKLVATAKNGQIYTSTDSGETWTARENIREWWPVASSSDGSKLVAAEHNGQLYTSTDSGVTWTAQESSRGWVSVASSSDGGKLVAVASGGQIYTSAGPALPLALTVNEDNGAYTGGTAFATSISAGPADESAQVVDFLVSNDNNALFSSQPAIAADGTLTFTPAVNAAGTATVTVRAHDDGGTANGGVDTSAAQTFTITVTPVNDAPSITLAAATVTVLEDSGAYSGGLATFSKGPADESGQNITAVTVTANNNPSLFSVAPAVSTSGVLTYTPVANANGSATVTIRAQDNGGTANGGVDLSAPVSFTIVVTGVNDAPSFALPGGPVAVAAQGPWTVTTVATGFNHAVGMAKDSAGNLFACDAFNNKIKKITPGGAVSDFATGILNPGWMTIDGADNLYVTSGDASLVQKITPAGVVTTVASFSYPTGIVRDSAGNLFVASGNDNTIRKITPAGDVTTIAGTAGQSGGTDGTGAAARFNAPMGMGIDSADNLYVVEQNNHTLRKITPGGVVTTVAGVAGSAGAVDDTGSAARFSNPQDVKVDAAGNLLVVEMNNHAVRQVTPAGVVTTIIGVLGDAGFVDGTGAAVRFNAPRGLMVDGAGAVYIGEWGNNAVRKAVPAVAAVAGGAPLVVAVTEDSGAYAGGASFATSISAGPADESAQVVDFLVSNDNNALFSSQPAIAADGTLTFTPAVNAAGTATVTVRAHDDGGTANGGVDTSAAQTFTITVAEAARRVFVSGTPTAAQGDTLTVPIMLKATGVEAGLGFTLNFDASKLSYRSAALGGDASGASLHENSSSAGSGRVGLVVARPAGSTFSAGAGLQVVLVTFQVNPTAAVGSSPVTFTDVVSRREVSDASANAVAAVFAGGSVTITVGVASTDSNYEGDVAPRPYGNGNGSVTVADAVQIGRFAAGLDAVANGSEFQRADCAPFAAKGDGRITVSDYVQALRFAATLDTPGTVGGPLTPASLQAASSLRVPAGARVVRVVGGNLVAGQANTVTVQMDSQGNEAGLSLSLAFDATALTFVSATTGSGASGGSLMVNSVKAAAGKVGLVLVMPAGSSIAAGTRDIVTLTFNVTGSGSTAISVTGDSPVAREVADVNANILGASFVGGSFNIILPAGLKAAGMERAADGSLRLVVRNTDGTPVTAAQAAKYEVYVTSNLGGAWTVLPNALVIENGALKIVDPAANGAGLRLYKLVETP